MRLISHETNQGVGAAIITGLLWVLYRSKNWVEIPTKEMNVLTPEEEQKIMDDLGRFEKS